MKPITGSKNIDIGIRAVVVGVAGYAGYKLYKLARDNKWFSKPDSGEDVEIEGCEIGNLQGHAIRNEMKLIYDNLIGVNFFYYPEFVNAILAYNICEAKYAAKYFKQTYGYKLYDFIYWEWDGTQYDAALNKLHNYGLSDSRELYTALQDNQFQRNRALCHLQDMGLNYAA